MPTPTPQDIDLSGLGSFSSQDHTSLPSLNILATRWEWSYDALIREVRKKRHPLLASFLAFSLLCVSGYSELLEWTVPFLQHLEDSGGGAVAAGALPRRVRPPGSGWES